MAKKLDLDAMKSNLRGTIKKKRVSFIPTAEDEAGSVNLVNTVADIPVAQISPNPFNPRQDFEQEALEELAASLKVHGLVQPITVRKISDNQYQIISGERRWRASKMAGLTAIPAYVRAVKDDQEMLEMALVENIQRENLNPIEVAITYQRLIDECNLTHELLSQRLGKGRPTITNKLGLLNLPPDLQKALRDGEISEGHARAIKGLEFIEQQLLVLKEIREKDLSVRATEKLVSSLKKGKKSATPSPKPHRYESELKSVKDEISAFFGVKVDIKANDKGKGQVVIPFNDFKKLNELLDRIR